MPRASGSSSAKYDNYDLNDSISATTTRKKGRDGPLIPKLKDGERDDKAKGKGKDTQKERDVSSLLRTMR
jgi:hypothetical protein